jgi:hypothetical protein
VLNTRKVLVDVAEIQKTAGDFIFKFSEKMKD